MYPGIDKKICREAKLNRILDEDSNVYSINCNFSTEKGNEDTEFKMSLIKYIDKYIEDIPKIKIDKIDDISLFKSKVDMVMSGAVASVLQDRIDFEFVSTGKIYNNEYVYDIGGRFSETNIHVNAFMSWDNHTVIVVKKPFYNYSDYTLGEPIEVPTFRIKHIGTYNIYFPKDKSEYIEVYEITTKIVF